MSVSEKLILNELLSITIIKLHLLFAFYVCVLVYILPTYEVELKCTAPTVYFLHTYYAMW